LICRDDVVLARKTAAALLSNASDQPEGRKL